MAIGVRNLLADAVRVRGDPAALPLDRTCATAREGAEAVGGHRAARAAAVGIEEEREDRSSERGEDGAVHRRPDAPDPGLATGAGRSEGCPSRRGGPPRWR